MDTFWEDLDHTLDTKKIHIFKSLIFIEYSVTLVFWLTLHQTNEWNEGISISFYVRRAWPKEELITIWEGSRCHNLDAKKSQIFRYAPQEVYTLEMLYNYTHPMYLQIYKYMYNCYIHFGF